MIKISNLHYSVPTGKSILEGIDFEMEKGHFLGVLGKNGAGKTTLIDLLLGVRPITQGEISIFGENPFHEKREQKNKIVFLSQDVSLPIAFEVQYFLDFHGHFYPNYSKTKEKDLCEYFDIDPSQMIGSLSTGQKKKIQIIANLSAQTELILIDEITAVLDPETRMKFFHLLKNIQNERQSSVILATNIVEDLKGKVDKILFIENKKSSIHEPGDIDKLFNLEGAPK